MFDGTPVVVCVPAGRKRTLTPLLYHLRSMGDLIDRIDLWENTTVEEDLEFIHSQVNDTTRVVPLDDDLPRNESTNPAGERRYARDNSRFYRQYEDPEPVYVRIDDDVVWMHPNAIGELVRVRLENPHPLLVSANVWNSAVFTNISQQAGAIPRELIPWVEMYCMDEVGWGNGSVAVTVHEFLLDHIDRGDLRPLMLEDTNIFKPNGEYPQFSTNCVALLGADWIRIKDDIYDDEEESYLMRIARRLRRPHMLAGAALVAHYSFWKQRPVLDSTNILDRYTSIAEDTYHNSYYRLMGFK